MSTRDCWLDPNKAGVQREANRGRHRPEKLIEFHFSVPEPVGSMAVPVFSASAQQPFLLLNIIGCDFYSASKQPLE